MVKLKLQLLIICLLATSMLFQNVSDDVWSQSPNVSMWNVDAQNDSSDGSSMLSIGINDSITVDYMMDDANWKYVNLSLDDTLFSENDNFYSGASFNAQAKMNQLKTVTNELVTNSSAMVRNFNETSRFASSLNSQSLIKIDDSIHWPIKKEAVVEGHVILGGLMMVHEREDNMTCGPIMPQGGIQALEAMLFTLDKINEMKLLNNITIGAHILDDCDKDTYGLEMAVDFIRGECHFQTLILGDDWENPSTPTGDFK